MSPKNHYLTAESLTERTSLPDQIFREVCAAKSRSDGCPPSLYHLAGKVGASEAEIDAALQGLARAGKLDYFPRQSVTPVIIVKGGKWLAPGQSAPVVAPASALKVNGGDYTPPADLESAQRDARHFHRASLMHLSEVTRLQGLIARFGSESQSVRKLKLENRTLREENARLQASARASAAAWLGIARRNQKESATALLPN